MLWQRISAERQTLRAFMFCCFYPSGMIMIAVVSFKSKKVLIHTLPYFMRSVQNIKHDSH